MLPLSATSPRPILQAMLLEQGYGQQLIGHLQQQQQQQQSPPPLPLQRDTPLPHFDRGGGAEAAPQSEGGPTAQARSSRHSVMRSVYTQTSPERLGSFEDEPGMSHAHEARLVL